VHRMTIWMCLFNLPLLVLIVGGVVWFKRR
jgi:hypothetical protein